MTTVFIATALFNKLVGFLSCFLKKRFNPVYQFHPTFPLPPSSLPTSSRNEKLNENDVYLAYLPLAHIMEIVAECLCLSLGDSWCLLIFLLRDSPFFFLLSSSPVCVTPILAHFSYTKHHPLWNINGVWKPAYTHGHRRKTQVTRVQRRRGT